MILHQKSVFLYLFCFTQRLTCLFAPRARYGIFAIMLNLLCWCRYAAFYFSWHCARSLVRSRLMLRVITSSSHFQSSKMHKRNSHCIHFDTNIYTYIECRWVVWIIHGKVITQLSFCKMLWKQQNANIKWGLSFHNQIENLISIAF